MDFNHTVLSNLLDQIVVHADSSTDSPAVVDQTGRAFNHQKNAISDRTEFGRNLRLAMACMDGAERWKNLKAANESREHTGQNKFDVTDTTPPQRSSQALSTQLQTLSAEVDVHRAELVELLLQFDEQQGWAAIGAHNCAEWANDYLGIAKVSVYAYLRVGRRARELPVTRVLFRGGELSWSKVRLLVGVADADNERQLVHASVGATVADVDRICKEFRWQTAEPSVEPDDHRTAEDIAVDLQFRNRGITWRELPDGSTTICITLPPEKAQAVLKSIEHCENELYGGLNTKAPSLEDIDASHQEAPNNEVGNELGNVGRSVPIVPPPHNDELTQWC